MSNKVVSLTFRHIIDDVIANVRQDFEDMGIEKEVLEELQRSWEAKLIATQVTEFDGANSGVPGARPPVQYTTTPGVGSSSASDPKVKSEPKDNGESASDKNKPSGTKRKHEDEDDEANNEIGSDLDDSEEEDAEGNEDMMLCLYDKVGDRCFYSPPLTPQVQRVKNKWKCVLRDGVASVGGRDYLFSKCNGFVAHAHPASSNGSMWRHVEQSTAAPFVPPCSRYRRATMGATEANGWLRNIVSYDNGL